MARRGQLVEGAGRVHPRVVIAAGLLTVLVVIIAVVVASADDAEAPGRTEAVVVRPATPAELAACRRENDGKRVAFRCPAAFPTPGGFERARQFAADACESLIDFEPRGMRPESGSVFHMLVGARCGAMDLRERHGRWPVDAGVRRDMRLVGSRAPRPPAQRSTPIRLLVLRHARVNGRPALVLRNPPYPDGGIHGGHLTVLTTSATTTYAVTGHPPIPEGLRDDSGELDPAALRRDPGLLQHERRAVAQLLAVAGSLTAPAAR
jgi:hypothetical protein